MKHDKYGQAIVKTAGLGVKEGMTVTTGLCQCGDIKDGVAFDIGNGGWVISTEDFLALADEVRANRAALKAVEEGRRG